MPMAAALPEEHLMPGVVKNMREPVTLLEAWQLITRVDDVSHTACSLYSIATAASAIFVYFCSMKHLITLKPVNKLYIITTLT